MLLGVGGGIQAFDGVSGTAACSWCTRQSNIHCHLPHMQRFWLWSHWLSPAPAAREKLLMDSPRQRCEDLAQRHIELTRLQNLPMTQADHFWWHIHHTTHTEVYGARVVSCQSPIPLIAFSIVFRPAPRSFERCTRCSLVYSSCWAWSQDNAACLHHILVSPVQTTCSQLNKFWIQPLSRALIL